VRLQEVTATKEAVVLNMQLPSLMRIRKQHLLDSLAGVESLRRCRRGRFNFYPTSVEDIAFNVAVWRSIIHGDWGYFCSAERWTKREAEQIKQINGGMSCPTAGELKKSVVFCLAMPRQLERWLRSRPTYGAIDSEIREGLRRLYRQSDSHHRGIMRMQLLPTYVRSCRGKRSTDTKLSRLAAMHTVEGMYNEFEIDIYTGRFRTDDWDRLVVRGECDAMHRAESDYEMWELWHRAMVMSPGSNGAPKRTDSPVSPKQRFRILQRDNFQCQLCGRSRADGAVLEVDHRTPVSKGGKSTDDNLWALCWECNRGKSATTICSSERSCGAADRQP